MLAGFFSFIVVIGITFVTIINNTSNLIGGCVMIKWFNIGAWQKLNTVEMLDVFVTGIALITIINNRFECPLGDERLCLWSPDFITFRT